MLDHIGEPVTNQSPSQQQQPQQQSQSQSTTSNSQTSADFDSILQDLRSVGQAHQSVQPTTMIVENITANIKSEPQTISQNSNGTSKFIDFSFCSNKSDI